MNNLIPFSKLRQGLAILLIFGITALARLANAQTNSLKTTLATEERFDEVVRDDFFSGDSKLIAKAMAACETALAKNPHHAQALVWHGTGLLGEGGQAFQTCDYVKGSQLWNKGLDEMNRAVALEPTNIAVLIPRAATLIESSKYVPDPNQAKKLLQTAVDDYEKIFKLQTPYLKTLSTHARGELLSALAGGWSRLDHQTKFQFYAKLLLEDCKGSSYATRASDWLNTPDRTALTKKVRMAKCIGCHAD